MVRVSVIGGDPLEGESAARDAVMQHIRTCMGCRPERVVARFTGDGWDVELMAVRSRISRIRRVTGYLSDLDNFGDAKAAEEGNRRVHMRVTQPGD